MCAQDRPLARTMPGFERDGQTEVEELEEEEEDTGKKPRP